MGLHVTSCRGMIQNLFYTNVACLFQIFIDRDPQMFARILNYLRTKEVDLK